MELFAYTQKEKEQKEGPLAARMRPRTLDEYIGQEHILAPGRLLRRAIQADQLTSLIFFGPPGTGKTTLATVIANTTKSTFVTLNAVLSGVKELREVTDAAKERRELYQKRTILFIDEVHRWNKAQQDALLPWVENGTIILIGATTENPYFSVNKALVSRSRVFQLLPLTEKDLHQIVRQALSDPIRGYGLRSVEITSEAIDHLINVSNGDARTILNALELAVETTLPNSEGKITISIETAEESIQKRAVLYDKEGDYHFDTISAFIKSMRGSDPDATLYWLAKMVHAGEDPNYLFRRMIIFASEDVGMADPNALQFVTSAAQAFDRVGLPEGRFMLGQAAIYLATAPKSNSVFAFFDALNLVEKEKSDDVPSHLRDANRDHESFGHGKGYLYPHAYQDHWVAQQYLPNSLQGKLFYTPSQLGYEKEIAEQVSRRREIQLAAALNSDPISAPQEILTFSPQDRMNEQWLNRAISGASEHFSQIRQTLFGLIQPARHALFLDLNADDGLLTWEALRQAPEGGVWSIVKNKQAAQSLKEQAEILSALNRPEIRTFSQFLELSQAKIQFDFIIGRQLLSTQQITIEEFKNWISLLSSTGQICLAENLPRDNQRLYHLLSPNLLPETIYQALIQAEEDIYRSLKNWDEDLLKETFPQFSISSSSIGFESQVRFSAERIQKWFTPGTFQRPSYQDHLKKYLTDTDITTIKRCFEKIFINSSIPWKNTTTIFHFIPHT